MKENPSNSNSVELPLSGKRIVITRPEDQSGNMVSMLEKAGATVLALPTIKIVPAKLSGEDQSRIARFCEYDVVIFPSANSAGNLFSKISVGMQPPAKPYVIAVGRRTAEAIAGYGVRVDLVPENFTSEDLKRSMADLNWKGKRVLIPVGNLSTRDLGNFVESKGGVADQVVVYETLPNDSVDVTLKSEIGSGQFDVIIFYSPSQARNFIEILGVDVLKEKPIAVIGPTTKRAVEHYGLDVAIIPDNSTTEDLIASLLDYEKIR
jgi:uroporphyrinogen-III synthase